MLNPTSSAEKGAGQGWKRPSSHLQARILYRVRRRTTFAVFTGPHPGALMTANQAI